MFFVKKLLLNIWRAIKIVFFFRISGFKLFFSKDNILTFSNRKFFHPIYIRNKTSDLPTFEQVFLNKEYSLKLDFQPEIIIDCGANVGYAAVYFKNQFPKSRIISIEPEQSNYDLLLKNTQNYEGISCLKGAIWNKSTELEIKDVGLGNWGFMIEETNKSTPNSIKAFTINSIMEQFSLNHIDILKIDIEGSEKELFQEGYESWLSKTKVLIVELHDNMRDGCSKSFFKALNNYKHHIKYKGENIYVFMK